MFSTSSSSSLPPSSPPSSLPAPPFLISTVICLFLVLTLVISNRCNIALGHESFEYGNFTITPGWQVEPPLVNQLNSIEINVTKAGADSKVMPVRNAFSDLEASIGFGGLTKPLDLQPQEESAGLYRAQILPTQLGSYSLVLIGRIQNQSINSQVPIEDVEDIVKLAFPIEDIGGAGPGPGIQGSQARQQDRLLQQHQQQQLLQLQQLSPMISDLTLQLNEANETASEAQNIAEESTKAMEELKNSSDRAYVFGVIGIGIGIAGIIIGATALSRKSIRGISKQSKETE